MLNVRGYEHHFMQMIDHNVKLANLYSKGYEESELYEWLLDNYKYLKELSFSSWKECTEFVLHFFCNR